METARDQARAEKRESGLTIDSVHKSRLAEGVLVFSRRVALVVTSLSATNEVFCVRLIGLRERSREIST